MRSKSLLGMAQFAIVAAIGLVQMHQVVPVMSRIVHRATEPLALLVQLETIPSVSASTVSAAQRDVQTAQLCPRSAATERPAATAQHITVRAQRPVVETISDPVRVRFLAPRFQQVRIERAKFMPAIPVPPSFPQAIAFEPAVQAELTSAQVQAEVARAQAQLEREMERLARMHRDLPASAVITLN